MPTTNDFNVVIVYIYKRHAGFRVWVNFSHTRLGGGWALGNFSHTCHSVTCAIWQILHGTLFPLISKVKMEQIIIYDFYYVLKRDIIHNYGGYSYQLARFIMP